MKKPCRLFFYSAMPKKVKEGFKMHQPYKKNYYSPLIKTLLSKANDWRRLFEILPSKSKSP